MKRTLILAIAAVLAVTATASAQSTVFVVRHAERADAGAAAAMMATDPDLSETGKARAQSLAAALRDAGIAAIYTTQYKRTQQTAEPLAKALGIQPLTVQSRDLADLVQKLKAVGGNALVVGHSNSVGEIISALGVADPVKLGEDDYDNLFVVVRGEKPTLIRLHFR